MKTPGLFSALRPVLVAALALIAAGGALAHGLVLTAQGEGAEINGQVRYSDDSPAAGIFVSAYPAQGDAPALAEGQTGVDGRFRLPAPAGQPLRVVAEGEEGHRAEVLAQPLPAAAGAGSDAGAAALRLLREDIARLEHRIRLQDILGGIGYIVGIAGIAAWFAARRQR